MQTSSGPAERSAKQASAFHGPGSSWFKAKSKRTANISTIRRRELPRQFIFPSSSSSTAVASRRVQVPLRSAMARIWPPREQSSRSITALESSASLRIPSSPPSLPIATPATIVCLTILPRFSGSGAITSRSLPTSLLAAFHGQHILNLEHFTLEKSRISS